MDWIKTTRMVWIIVMFLSAVWTIILTAMAFPLVNKWWMLNFSRSVHEETNSSTSWMAWGWVHYQHIVWINYSFYLKVNIVALLALYLLVRIRQILVLNNLHCMLATHHIGSLEPVTYFQLPLKTSLDFSKTALSDSAEFQGTILFSNQTHRPNCKCKVPSDWLWMEKRAKTS